LKLAKGIVGIAAALALTWWVLPTPLREVQTANLRERLQRNLLRNGGFEEGLSFWSTEHHWYARGEGLSQWEVDETIVKVGKRSAKVIGKNNRGIAIQDLRPPSPTCLVSGWLRCENLKGYARIFVEFIDAEGKWLAGVVVGEVTGTTDWTFVSKEVTMPPEAAVFRVDLLTTDPNDGVAWFDEISVVPVLPPSDGKPPKAPKFRVEPVEGEEGTLRLTWEPPEDDVIAFQVFAEPKPFKSVEGLNPKAILHRHIRSFVLRGLEVGRDYFVALAAIDVDGMRSDVEVQRCRAVDLCPPKEVWWEWEPKGAGKIQFTWRPETVDEDDIAYFLILVRTGEGDEKVLLRRSHLQRTATVKLPAPQVTAAVVAIDKAGNRSQPLWRIVSAPTLNQLPLSFAKGQNVRLEGRYGSVKLAPEGWHPTRLPADLNELIRPKQTTLARDGFVLSPTFTISASDVPPRIFYFARVPEGTNLRVDIVDANGNLLVADVKPNSQIPRGISKPIQLKAMLKGDGANTPEIFAWGIQWSPKARETSPARLVERKPDESVEAGFASPLENIFRDTKPPNVKIWTLRAARGETEAVQLVLRSKEDWAWVKVKVPEEVLRDFAVRIRFVGYVPLRANSRATPAEELVRKAPDDFPDPILDLPFVPLKANETQPVFITVQPHRKTKPGDYTLPVLVEMPLGTIRLELRVRVDDVLFPERTRLWFTNWFRADNFARFHGFPQWGNEHFRCMRSYARLMREHRQNVVLVPLGLVKVFRRPDGSFRFDFSLFDRFIATFETEGVAERLELSHIGGRKTGRWEDPEFVATTFWATDELTGEGVEVPLETFLQAVRDHLKATGRLKKAMLHIADEPIPVNVASWKALSQRVHLAVPDLPRIDAIHVSDLEGYLEVWVPQLNYFAQWLDVYRQRQREGNEVWFYTAWVPQGKWTNRLIDYPLIKTRLLHWLNVRYGATGFLHWGWNFWGDVMAGELQSPGDAFIVYPGPAASLRMEAQRDGIEDAELLWMLAEKLAGKRTVTPQQAAQILEPLLKPVIRDFTDYTKDPNELERVRKQVLEELQRLKRGR
jgi:hypothetical protein